MKRKRLNMSMLKDKVVIVTGGTKGIGYATVHRMSDEGAIVYACARHKVVFEKENIHYHYVDVTDKDSCKKLFEYVVEKHGKIDVLVANAGITSDALTVKMTDQMFDDVINTNIKGVFNIVSFVGPYMERQGYGSIITTSSVVGEYGNIGQANYAASKAGVIGMTKSWAKEFARRGAQVRVNSIAPGYILTDMLGTVPKDLLEKFSEQTMLKRLGKPEEIANTVLFLASDWSSYITGTVIDANGGMRL